MRRDFSFVGAVVVVFALFSSTSAQPPDPKKKASEHVIEVDFKKDKFSTLYQDSNQIKVGDTTFTLEKGKMTVKAAQMELHHEPGKNPDLSKVVKDWEKEMVGKLNIYRKKKDDKVVESVVIEGTLDEPKMFIWGPADGGVTLGYTKGKDYISFTITKGDDVSYCNIKGNSMVILTNDKVELVKKK